MVGSLAADKLAVGFAMDWVFALWESAFAVASRKDLALAAAAAAVAVVVERLVADQGTVDTAEEPVAALSIVRMDLSSNS